MADQNFADLVSNGYSLEAAEKRLAAVLDADDAISVRARYEMKANVIRLLEDESAIIDPSVNAWYRPEGDGRFFAATRLKLGRDLPAHVVAQVSDRADQVLGSLANPRSERFSSRGLVIGYVQSGKTTSFISLAAKAADAGYKLIIILSGLTDNLRTQTQYRVDTTLIGDLAGDWRALTTQDSDFQNSGKPDADLNRKNGQPCVAVVKKNPSRLQALIDWLERGSSSLVKQTPILIIDDEADQATPNTAKGKDRATKINSLLRTLAGYPKAAYVAYTATPFANLLMDAQSSSDLYPRDFIVSLPEPDGYVGTSRMFGRDRLGEGGQELEPLDVVRDVTDDEARLLQSEARSGDVSGALEADALRDAVSWFLLATTARRIRSGETKHSSMLVNISSLSDSHFRTGARVQGMLQGIDAQLMEDDSGLRETLTALWERELEQLPPEEVGEAEVPFDEIWLRFAETLRSTIVIVDNYRSPQRLVYTDEDPLTVIVVGGNTMSRGLTLEGLISSYFLRTSRTYDTLLQMGRWFGFRPGYLDLVRVWMPRLLQQWFRDLALVEAEIREEIRRYAPVIVNGEVVGGEVRPNQIAVRIRQHPAMAVVAAAKARHMQKVSLSYSGQVAQTILFESDDAAAMDANIEATKQFFDAIRSGGGEEITFPSGRRGFAEVRAESIIEFLRNYSVHPEARAFLPDKIVEYIEKELRANGLRTWNVVVAGVNGAGTEHAYDIGLATPVGLIRRTRRGTADSGARIGALVSGGDRILDVRDDALYRDAAATEASSKDKRARLWKEDHGLRDGLLVIYPIDMNSQRLVNGEVDTKVSLRAAQHVIGLGVFFPPNVGAHSAVEYVAAALPEWNLEDEEAAEAEALAADERDSERMHAQESESLDD